jgi:uncharacterized membrane protein YgcG
MSLFSASSTLCEVAADICFGCSVVIPEAPFCAFAIQDGKGDAGAIEDAADKWRDASNELHDAHDQLASFVNSIPESEWQSTDRQLYEQTAEQYLQQLQTSATAAEVAGDLLTTAAVAILAFAGFAMGVAAALAIDAVAVAAADCTVVGAPEAEAEAAATGAAAMEVLESATTVLFAALDAVAGVLGVGAIVDAGILMGQGDTSAAGDFSQAVISGLGDDLKELPKELADYAQGKLIDSVHGDMFPESGGEGGGSHEPGGGGGPGGGAGGGSHGSGGGGPQGGPGSGAHSQ